MKVTRRMNDYECAQFARAINDSTYYGNIERTAFNGTLCYGMYDEDASLVAGVMLLIMGRHAYLDYLYVLPRWKNQGFAVKLLDTVRQLLRTQGVRYVYTCISGENEAAGKLAARHFGTLGFPYMHVVIDLEEEEHGQQEV